MFKQRHLLYFVTVAQEGQITLAAEKLGIAQGAVSQAIARLESDLGFQVLERHGRGVTLTPAGEVFLPKARAAIVAEEEASLTADSLARISHGRIALGYSGLPPASSSPDLIEAFTRARPGVELNPQELPFPSVPTGSWLREVDAAIFSQPPPDPNVSIQTLRAEPRVVLVPRSHPLAGRRELTVAEVLDETFLGFHPSIDPAWAGFWSLDDHRGGPAPHIVGETADAQQRFGMLAAGRGIGTAPAYAAAMVKVLPSIVAIPLTDADPAIITLAARKDRQHSLVEDLFTLARQISPHLAGDPAEPSA
ncbi:MAG: LysR family transcriptional regulator [Solirubrobacteraceae bacterium]